MRIQILPDGTTNLWLSANDTYNWATRPSSRWPCSQLANRRLFAQFDRSGDLVDMSVDGGKGEQDIDGNEFNAIVSDHLRKRDVNHPAIRQSS